MSLNEEEKNKMISIVIPTLQKNFQILLNLLTVLNNDTSVGEILVIDNSCKGFKHNLDKVRIIMPEKNIYVNPSWNLGVKESKYDYVALFNDDLLVSKSFCSRVYPLLSKDKGLFGIDNDFIVNMGEEGFEIPIKEGEITIKPAPPKLDRTCFFGCLMFFHKDSYYEIPEEMKIFCGDDFLYDKNIQNGKQNYTITGEQVKHFGSLSSSLAEFSEIEERDLIAYAKINKDFWYNNPEIQKEIKNQSKEKVKFIEKLFSVKNKDNNKIVRVLGLKFKFPRKNK